MFWVQRNLNLAQRFLGLYTQDDLHKQ